MKKLLSLTLLGALLLTACQTTGKDLQGKFGTTKVVMTMSLSPGSPSGARSVSASDDFMEFGVGFNQKNRLPAGAEFRVDIKVDSLDPVVAGETITLKDGATVIGTGEFVLIDPANPYEGFASVTTSSAVNFAPNTPKTFTLTANTANLLMEEPAVDDDMVAIVEYNGQKVVGNTIAY